MWVPDCHLKEILGFGGVLVWFFLVVFWGVVCLFVVLMFLNEIEAMEVSVWGCSLSTLH